MRWLVFVLLAVLPMVGQTPRTSQKVASKKAASKKKSAPAEKAVSPPPAVPNKWPIASLTIEGNKNYTKEQVAVAAGLKVGAVVGEDEFEAARARLLASGRFESVGFKFAPAPGSNQFAASFQVVEVEPLYPVRFDRVDLPLAELKGWLKDHDVFFGERIPPTKNVLEKGAKAIEEFAKTKSKGEPFVGRVVSDKPGEYAIVFSPARREPVIGEVKFEGNQAIPTPMLLTAFSGVAYGVAYREPSFLQMLDAGVRPMYDSRGRIRAKFTVTKTEKLPDVDGLRVSVKVEEGPIFRLGEGAFDGEMPVPARELLRAAALKKEEPVNFDEVNESVTRMRKRLRRDGYMQAAIETERKIDDEKKVVDLIFKITPGPQYIMGTLTLKGLDLDGVAAVKKLWSPKEGAPFNADYPDFFLKRLEEDGVFDELGKTKASLAVNDAKKIVDVTLEFSAAPTGSDGTGRGRSRRRRP